MNYAQTIQYLYEQLPVFHRIGAAAYKPDMGNIAALCEMLGRPQHKFKSIHIAGTNGKGSVSHMLASILQEAGYKAGLHTSPHLKDYRERFRINGRLMPKKEVVEFVKKWKTEFEQLKPSFFEMSVALAFNHFASNKVDVAVIETGMGGRLDSTNVITPQVSVITNIGWDHMMFLGNTLAKIALEKAGIIKHKVPVVVGESHSETRDVFINRAMEMQSRIWFADDAYKVEKLNHAKITGTNYQIVQNSQIRFRKLFCPLGGDYQIRNIATVLQTVDVLRDTGYEISETNIAQGISHVVRNTGLKGRWQVLSRNPLTIADIGHNKDGISWVVNQLKRMKYRSLHIVLGMVNDKDAGSILSLLPADAVYYYCRPDIPRGLDANLLRDIALRYNLQGQSYGSVDEAYSAAKLIAGNDDLIYIGGSTFVVAEVV